ncbi:MAG: IS66 family insertion sequence element accessory protein TnpB [Shewanella fodinae]|jgi:hypothetical protein|nr:IS66 family insertion sequence element accessory protein TnpB [Shewanella fodinae]
MAIRRSDHEWQILFEQYASCQLSQRAFCAQHGLSLSTFNNKYQQTQRREQSQTTGFIKANVIETTTINLPVQTSLANMTLFIHGAELSIPQGTPAAYVAELIGALS